jgi:hypothetical protein
MGLESNVDPLPDEDPAWGRIRFVCDRCGEAMLSRDGTAIVLPVEHGGEWLYKTLDQTTGDPMPRRYYVHRVDCEWHFIHEHGWTPEDYFSEDIRYKD